MNRSHILISYGFRAGASATWCIVGYKLNLRERWRFAGNNGFPASRGLSRRGKNERKERDLCRLPTRFLSRMRWRFLNNQWFKPVTFFSRATQPTEPVCARNFSWRSLSFLSFLPRRERPLLAGKFGAESYSGQRKRKSVWFGFPNQRFVHSCLAKLTLC